MSERSPGLLLEDILDSIEKIQSYTAGFSFDDFMNDSKTVDAVIRNFEIIGEAAGRIPDHVKTDYPAVDWHRIRGFRNRIVHHYFGIDYEIVWEIIQNNLDELKDVTIR